jgi:signal transduction histidine kinase
MARLCGGAAGFELYGQVDVEGVREPFQDGQCRYGAAGFEAGNGGLGHAGGCGELSLTPAVSFAEFADGDAEFEGEASGVVLLDRAAFGHAAVVRDAIARTLRDPLLELAFWLPDRRLFVDADGAEIVEPAPHLSVTPLSNDGRLVAALIHDPALAADPELLAAVGAAASLALENTRLQAELRAQLAEVRASRARLLNAGDAERRRLERDLHDGAQQRLLGIRLALQLARNRLARGGTAIDDLLCEVDAEVGGALEEMRALARGIHPAILTQEGLAAALHALVRRTSVPVELNARLHRLPPSVEATAYFVAAEALANVVKHAYASRVIIYAVVLDGKLAIEITDDGVGGADVVGAGLRGLQDRVEALGGRLAIESQPGRGTRVSAAIPCG